MSKKHDEGSSPSSYNLIRLLLIELDLVDDNNVDNLNSTNLITIDESFEQIMNMLRLPIALEKVISFGTLSCMNSFLRILIILPLRLIFDLIVIFNMIRNQFVNKKNKFHYKLNRSNIIFGSLVFLTIYISTVDTSKIYHKIRNQSSIKLYVMFGVLEISDKLLSTIGQDILNVLFTIKINRINNFIKFSIFYLLAIGYLSLHTIVLIYQTISLTVAANSYSNSLVTLLLSNQFSEIKSSVFKKIDKEGLFQITCSDIVERFQLFIMLLIITLRNLVQLDFNTISYYSKFKIIFGPTMIVIGSEILVDWIKHSYITKFNKIRPKIYLKFQYLLSNDFINNFKSINLINNTNYNDKLQQRLGLPLPALYILFVIMIKDCFKWLLFDQDKLILINLIVLVIIYILTLVFKLLLELTLLKWSNKIIKNHNNVKDYYVPGLVSGGFGAINKEDRKLLYGKNEEIPIDIEKKRNSKEKDNLHEVMRYKMNSKQIW